MRATIVLISVFCFSQANAYLLPQHPIKSYDCDICNTLSQESLHDQWKTNSVPLKKASSNIQKSYSYNQRVTEKQLEQGVILPTHAPGAVVRITPLQDKTIPALEFKNAASSQFMSLKDASSLYGQDEALDESLRIGPHQTMFQIKSELGFGNFLIKSNDAISQNKANEYLINVFEKYSLVFLQINPSALHYQYGDQFKATITLQDNIDIYSIDDISASLVGPQKQTIPLKIKEIKRNQFQASADLLSVVNPRGENWYIEVDVVSEQDDNGRTYRSGRAAFSYAVPSASLVSITKTSSSPLTLTATVDVATASRYALQSILYKKNAKDEDIPIETAQSAQWLKPGKQIIKFSFDNSAHLPEDQLSLGYLHLIDYGQLKTVYQYDQPIKLKECEHS